MKTTSATSEAATTTARCSSKSSTGNLLQTPMGVDNMWNNGNFHHYNDEDKRSHHQDEELTSMLQKYLDHNCGDQTSLDSFVYHQKSPGQLSTDSGFSGDQKLQVPFDLNDMNDYEDSGEDLSQLVDQVLSSIDAQFPVESYLSSPHHQQNNENENNFAQYENRQVTTLALGTRVFIANAHWFCARTKERIENTITLIFGGWHSGCSRGEMHAN